MKTKYLLAMGLTVAFSGTLIAGCGQQSGTPAATTQPVAKSDAPENSSADAAEAKTGLDHHADAAGEAKAHTHSTNLAFSSEPSALPVGKSVTWTLKITDQKSGQPIKDYEVVHDKLMHLIVVKKDLSWFNHIHPEQKGAGLFVVTTTLPTAGSYKLYADYTPKGGEQEIGTHEFATVGASVSSTSNLLVPDKMQGPWMTKRVTAHPEGQPDAKGGPTYEVALMPMPMPLRAGQDTMLHFQIRDAQGRPVKDLQPYLGAMGHCVVLSADTESYLHSHPMEGGATHDMSQMGDMKNMKHSAPPKSGGPDVIFHTNFPAVGQYKAWGQFMHRSKVITAGFVLTAGEAKVGAAAIPDHTHAPGTEATPHAH